MDDLQLKRQVLAEHLKALRKVFIVSLIAIAVLFVLTFYLLREPLMSFILAPLRERNIQVVTTQVSEALVMQLKVCLVAAVVLGMPVLTWQIWGFVSPALYGNEKKLFALLFFIGLVLFVIGVSFAYFYIFPLAINLFFEAGDGIAASLWSIDRYFGFTLSFILPFCLMFEMPIVIYMMARRGWVDYPKLARSRKYAALAISIVAAILTPPDILSQVMLGAPMYLLYEAGIQVSRFIKPREKVG